MKIIQIVKKLNNTELGKGGTHDTYVLIPNDLVVDDIFETANQFVDFTDKDNQDVVSVRNTVSREKRIVGLGQYYRDKDLCAGDEIIFEKQEGKNTKYVIYTNKYYANLVIQKSKYGFEFLSPEKNNKFLEKCKKYGIDLELKFLTSAKKRNDSPEETDFYDVLINGKSILPECTGKEIKEYRVQNGSLCNVEFYGWKKYVFETEEE